MDYYTLCRFVCRIDMDPRWQHPFTCIVAGPTGCGKTTFVARLLRNASAMIDPPPEHVTWYYGEWQAAYKNLDIPNMRMEEGLPTSFDNDDGKRGLVVLDPRRSNGGPRSGSGPSNASIRTVPP